ncbi:hypothetical protein BOW53_14710 [Solemya pervernicosa gill symbiont]|uniref:Uncharacterized protein n=2 Tax=Gammaproteobacteria incertae sedis TaxID=118884 RepID=A0A1T2L0L0_9GAMM|nr:hypothetical protein [Solemya pervernicosa gill symbiont]OOZ38643.1 hypothetical protein BOW53_14710 [Solemya pervernicosa gill symbiont]
MKYGVPEERWNRMGEVERAATIEAYEERQRIARERREAELARAEALRHKKAQRIERIHHGDIWYHGALIRVTIRKGKVKIGKEFRQYRPVSFLIADRETKAMNLHRAGKGKRDYNQIWFSYRNNQLIADVGRGGRNARNGHVFYYEPAWSRAKHYRDVQFGTKSNIKSDGMVVSVEVMPRQHR